MEGPALFFAILGFILGINAQVKIHKQDQRIKELEEPFKQKKRDAKLIAAAELSTILEKNKKKKS